MKKRRKLIALMLILCLSIGVTAFAQTCTLTSGNIKAKGELYRDKENAKEGHANTNMTSNHLYKVTATVMAYDSNGNSLGGNSYTGRTAAYTTVIASKKPYKFVSTHAIKDDNYKPYCSKQLTVY